MKIYEFVEPKDPDSGDFSPVYHRYSELEIILIYWGYWSRDVFRCRPDNTFKIIPENCIDDWVVVNWAYEVGEI